MARFTVDSRPEIGGIGQGTITVDINGNYTLDLAAGVPGGDDRIRDLAFRVGIETDAIFAGQFADETATSVDGFDRLGAYGLVGGVYRWLLDFDNDGVADLNRVSSLQINGIPIAGDFDPSHPGDEIGLFTGTTWYFDTNANNDIDAGDLTLTGNLQGSPIIGDFDGDGIDDLATYLASTNTFYFDLSSAHGSVSFAASHDANADDTMGPLSDPPPNSPVGLPGVQGKVWALASDFNLDGIDDIGIMFPNMEGTAPADTSEWYIYLSDAAVALPGTVNALDHPFSPDPLGNDLFARLGGNLALPIVGNFDPPASPGGSLPVVSNFDAGTGTLSITLTAGAELAVTDVSGAVQVLVNGSADPAISGVASADVQKIQILGSDGNDVVDLRGVTAAAFTNLATVNVDTAVGDDTVWGSELADSIFVSAGNDWVDGGPGNDWITDLVGNDTLLGGPGDDYVFGAGGDDSVDGGAGNDYVSGQ
ncbi:MAG TPA: calcium-binding protein, partial [Planctomycetaceae bacterium]|nr:calcium-binding protein [Planctomycetaceae bacterium]